MAYPLHKAVSSPPTPRTPSVLEELTFPDKKPVWSHQRSISCGPKRLHEQFLKGQCHLFSPTDPNSDLELIQKKEELVQYLRDNENELREEYSDKIQRLESSIARMTDENESYESQIRSFKEHNDHLREASTQSQTRYNQTKTSLSNANEEIINLKKELKDLQTLYKNDITQIQSSATLVLQDIVDEDDIKSTLQQYMAENTFLKKENLRLLNEVRDMNRQCRDMATQYDEMNRIHVEVQKELSASQLRVSELEKVLEDYTLDIQYLENQSEELKQNLKEASHAEWFDNNSEMNGYVLELERMHFTPDLRTRVRKRSIGSMNSVFLDNESACNSPVINHRKSWGGWIGLADLLMDERMNHDDAMEEDNKAMDDLYERMNRYVVEIQECIQAMKNIESLNSKPLMHKKRGSISLSQSNSCTPLDFEDRKSEEEEEEEVQNKRRESTEGDNLLKVIDKDTAQQQLMQMKDVVEQCKECMAELQKQQTWIIMSEKRKYQDLDKIFETYRMETVRKIKRLTVDMYNIRYKKYGGYKDICREMVGNVGTYTKDVLVYKLTHK